jgi:hypothetical protein
MKHRRLLLALPLSFALFGSIADPSWAQELNQYPALALERLTIGARAEYSFYSNLHAGDPDPPFQKEWAVGLVGSYALVPRLSAVAGTTMFLDSRSTRSWLGLNVMLFRGLK